MAPYRITIICFLAAISAFSRPAAAQEAQDLFKSELTEASLGKDTSRVLELISEHRLSVKPVVNQLISDYIHQTMMGNRGGAQRNKEAANLIATAFQETYGEKSLSIATGYLDNWTMEQLGKKAQADRIYGIATDLRLNGQAEEAIEEYHRGLELYSDIGDLRGQGEVLGGLGFIYWSIDTDTCLYYYQKALKARKEVDDKLLMGATLNSIGGVYLEYLGDMDSAKVYLEQAVEIREEVGYLSGQASSLYNLARVYDKLGELDLALQSYVKSYNLHQELGRQYMMAHSKIGSGTDLRQLGRYPKAMQDLETARDLSLELSDTSTLADTYNQMALVYDNIGDYERGIELVTIATGLYQQVDDQWGLAGAYNHTGIILQDADRKQRAEEFYLKALKIYQDFDDQENVISVLNNLGTVSFEQNDFTEAEAYNQQGLELSRIRQDKSGQLSNLINLANSQNRLENLDTAMQNYEQALSLTREINNPDNEWRILVGLAENCKLRGDYPGAIEYNEMGLSIIENLRSTFHSASEKSNYLARERYAFEDVIHMLSEQHEAEPGKGYDILAFEYAQRCKSRSFLEQIEGSEPITLKEVQGSGLDKNTVILEYSVGDSSSTLWVITPDVYQMFILPRRKVLEEQLETFRFSILNPDQDNIAFLQQSGHFLYKQLVGPAESLLKKKSRLIVLPDGILHYIPFEVLITKEAETDNDKPYSKLPYLGKLYPVSYGQSASAYKSTVENRASSDSGDQQIRELIAFGDPLYGDKYKRLEFSGKEVESIASLFPAGAVKTFLRGEATEENAKKENILPAYRHIHFATHGIVDEKIPGRSGLVLSQDSRESEDGILTAEEISAMNMQAELAVLSACQTGIGKMIRGEGMIGLSRSFMYAGVPSVVVSLWSVSDQSTTELMKRFYAYLIDKKLSKSEALQQARISMIKEELFAHPFFWAPFILTGDWY